jgi:hypothetical protein
MDDKYPELASRRHFLRAAYRSLQQAYDAGEWQLRLSPDCIAKIGEEIGFNQRKSFAKLKELVDGMDRMNYDGPGYGCVGVRVT